MIAVDIDGVICDFEKAFCRRFGRQNRHLYSLEQRLEGTGLVETAIAWVNDPNNYKDLQVISSGAKFIEDYQKHGHKVMFCTSRNVDTLKIVTLSWLKIHGFDYENVSFTANKIPYLERRRVGLLIDDNPKYAIESQEKGSEVTVLLWRQAWNLDYYPQVWEHRGQFMVRSAEWKRTERLWNDE